ncbi:MAG: GAF domain-containing sensor histidine kinase [Thermodesulfobacteriota bacterium]|nr:GAF domain-containing sensor histidine kinase [Thermodesulfobacteriota bacterium]
MDTLGTNQEHLESIKSRLLEKGFNLSPEDVNGVIGLIKDEIGYCYVKQLITQVGKILEINPSLTESEILQLVARTIVEYLGAEATSIRIYDPEEKGMVSYGSYPSFDESCEEVIPFEDTIAGEVIKTRQSYLVPNILREERYKNKEKVEKLGIRSMLAAPIHLHRFSKDIDIEGVFQIYYKKEDKVFTPLELEIAEMISKPVGYVMALKKINYFHKFNMTKDKILEHIYEKLARGEGIKMKDLFNSVIPELVDIMKVQRCSLFSVTEDREHIILEAGYPEAGHGIGNVRSVKEELYAKVIVDQTGPFGSFENEKIYPHYILIANPQGTQLLPADIKHFLETQQINSVLYIPLRMNESVKYFLVFDAQAQHQRFTHEEIDMLTFFGKELTKAVKLEKMDDILHDFRNPAIAVAGFAKKVQKILKEGAHLKDEKLEQSLDILLKETSRIQELALTLHQRGKESIVDLTEVLKNRFLINEDALKELNRGNIRLIERELESPLWIQCYPMHIERVIDNLLNNASNAIPEEGGELSIRSYRKDLWAVVEINNTCQISEEEKDQLILEQGKGRGLHICTRLVTNMRGKMWVEAMEGQITFSIMLPLVEP